MDRTTSKSSRVEPAEDELVSSALYKRNLYRDHDPNKAPTTMRRERRGWKCSANTGPWFRAKLLRHACASAPHRLVTGNGQPRDGAP